nr:MAG TPA: hypothetical protein [Caudoviricetes sp.]
MHRHGHTDAARRCRCRETGRSPSGAARRRSRSRPSSGRPSACC